MTADEDTLLQNISFSLSAILFSDEDTSVSCIEKPDVYGVINVTNTTTSQPWSFDNSHLGIPTVGYTKTFTSPDLAYSIKYLKNYYDWDQDSILSFHFTIDSYYLKLNSKNPYNIHNMSDMKNATKLNTIFTTDFKNRLSTQWQFYMITDAYPCIETNWSNWTLCNQSLINPPVGIGTQIRTCTRAVGLPGLIMHCSNLQQTQQCSVSNNKKSIDISRNEIYIKEGGIGEIIKFRLMSEINITNVNKSQLSIDRLRELRGYDVIIYFDIQSMIKNELAVDPNIIGWHADKWDKIHEVKITGLDDVRVDPLEQIIPVVMNIESVDNDYDNMVLGSIKVTLEDNENCEYCRLPESVNTAVFEPPSFWNWQTITAACILIGGIVVIVGIQIYKWKYGKQDDNIVENQEELLFDGLVDEEEIKKSEMMKRANILDKYKEYIERDTSSDDEVKRKDDSDDSDY